MMSHALTRVAFSYEGGAVCIARAGHVDAWMPPRQLLSNDGFDVHTEARPGHSPDSWAAAIGREHCITMEDRALYLIIRAFYEIREDKI